MAGNTDVAQLVINRMLGVEVREVNDRDEECRYLGDTGCIFSVKPVFCLNYNCKHILSHGRDESLRLLDQRSGQLLQYQLDIEKRLLESC